MDTNAETVEQTKSIAATNGVYKEDQSTQFKTKYAEGVDVKKLEAALKKAIEGEVRFDKGSRALYATDGSNYRQVPIGVVLPKTKNDILKIVEICREHGAPLLSRGGGTSLAGQCCNVAIVMDMTKYYNKVLEVNKEKKLVTVQPGIVLDEMKKSTEESADLTFGPDPATHSHCAIGGMLGNNSCGAHSVMAANEGYGARTSDNVQSLKILTYDGLEMEVGETSEEELERIIQQGGRKGEIYKRLRNLRDKYQQLIREKYPKIPRRVSGYNLDELLPENNFNVARALVGSEGTCVVITEATMKLMPKPKQRSLLVCGFKDVYEAGYHAPKALKFKPIALEGLDDLLIDYMKKKGLDKEDLPLLPKGNGWLMIEFDGETKAESDAKAIALMAEFKVEKNAPHMVLYDTEEKEKKLWEIRESGLGATAFIPGLPDNWPGWEDSAVPPEKVGDYLKDLKALFHKYGYKASVYGHFGQGCIHCRIPFDLETKEGIEKYKSFTIEGANLVVQYGGSISGEHGDGQARGDLLEIMYGKELIEAFKEFKSIWDLEWKMNPGKIIDTYGQLSNLRLGKDYEPKKVKTHFAYADDEHDFSRAALRCVGVGKCRRHEGGTMCPSYMVTMEEKHTTRGRAHALFEMLEGEVITDGWKSKEVKETLELCLSCKGCKGDCPVNVDIATYKAEFLSHYYKGKLRPPSAYAFGLIYWWSRLASKMPFIANFFFHAPVVSNVVKALAGIEQKRKMPRYAEITFKEWFFQRQKSKVKIQNKPAANSQQLKAKVILWVDTFNNYFLPETLVAATEVLEAAGFEVIVPKQSMCCGRPLYDFGMLDTAKHMLIDIMQKLREEIRNEIPIVGLEPSCVSVFKDELMNLFPTDKDAKRLTKNVFTLAQFLEQKAPDFKIPKVLQKAVVHGHCHHKAIMKFRAEDSVIQKTGLDAEILKSGCCGMAGGFGYEKGEHYKVSIGAGERVLLPAVRKAADTTLIIADGFSCREQIEQETDRKALHLAQVLQMGLRENNPSKYLPLPEKKYVDGMKLKDPNKKRKMMIAAGIAAFAVATLVVLNKKTK
ncbi:MAG TPA: FAD-binding and (Fe-S)-binding domain-containing protein [Parafilimonas sp.]|nr:FAD-binding and (Fe-S)-binding domain-containing protein [Parafilimonas sp.]